MNRAKFLISDMRKILSVSGSNGDGIPPTPNSGAPTAPGSTSPEDQKKSNTPASLWVILVIVIGAIIGALSYSVIITTHRLFIFPFRGPLPPGMNALMSYLAFHVILSTVSIGLLLALIAVYMRTFARTRARFVFGLLIVLFALLLQNLVTYPLFYTVIALQPIQYGNSGLTLTLADFFTIIAYAAFLYLSLE